MLSSEPQAWLTGRELLPVTALRDPTVELTGHHPCSNYVELFYPGFLGPSATMTARHLSASLELSPEGFVVPAFVLARQLGLGTGPGRHAPLTKTLARLASFGLAAVIDDRYALRVAFPPLTRRQVSRLTPQLAEAHQRIIGRLHPPTRSRPEADRTGLVTSRRCPAPVGEAGPGNGATNPTAPALLATRPGGPS